MLRSLAAVLVAVVAGVATARLVELAAIALFPGVAANGAALGAGRQLGLLAAWGLAAFVAAGASLLIGKRWAPLGWLAASAMLLLAIVSSLSVSGGALLLIPGAVAATAAGGYGAVRLLKARSTPPFISGQSGLFQ